MLSLLLFAKCLITTHNVTQGNSDAFRMYTDTVFAQFFKRELDIEDINKIADILSAAIKGKVSAQELQQFAQTEGQAQLEEIRKEADKDGVSVYLLFSLSFCWCCYCCCCC